MPKTLICGVVDIDGGYKQIQKALEKLGVSCPVNEQKRDWLSPRFSIELRDCPLTIQRIEEAGFENGLGRWYITQASYIGVALYWLHTSAGDGRIFIPMTNIIAIDDATDDQIEEIKEYAEFVESE